MELKDKRFFLEIYGILRMILGVGQLAGIFFGFFLIEFVVSYPNGIFLNVFDKEAMAITYMAVFFRGLFHLFAGMGIARIKDWGRSTLIFGWPLMIVVSFGVFFTLYSSWSRMGEVQTFSQIIAWPKLFVYIALVCFDWIIICPFIDSVVLESRDNKRAETGITVSHVTSIFFITLVLFTVLLFLGKPIKQGFHKGFYHSSGSKVEKGLKRELKTIQRKKGIKKAPTGNFQEKIREIPEVLVETDIHMADPTGDPKRAVMALQSVDKKTRRVKGALPYQNILGIMGGLFLSLGFVFQILDQDQKLSLSGMLFVTLGLITWIVYGFILHLWPIIVGCSISSLLCFIIATKIYQNDNQ